MRSSRLLQISFAVTLLALACTIGHRALAQARPNSPATPAWLGPVWLQALRTPFFVGQASQIHPPATIPQTLQSGDSAGILASYQPAGATSTSKNAYFASLGTNGRTCFTCHQPQAGWSMNPQIAVATFLTTKGIDPLFSPVDGANCPNLLVNARTLAQRAAASSQLLTKANMRIFLPVPAGAEFKVRIVRDPYGCETSSTYGLPAGILSMYRRVLNSANLEMNAQTNSPQGTIMWDGREPSLESQFTDATLGHAQALHAPTSEQVAQGVAFQEGLFTAQSFDNAAKSLTANGATGGPVALSTDPAVVNDAGKEGMTMFDAWASASQPARASIARGQNIFNTRQFTISGVVGLNDTRGNPATGTCAGCHSSQNMGSSANPGGKHLGIGDNSSADQSGNQTTATVLPPTPDQPLISLLCPRDINGKSIIPFFSNPVKIDGVTYDDFQTSDPGMGLISGKCADLGKFKVPRLRGLPARAPYFHGGNAASLSQLVDFYNQRFTIGLTKQEKQDLINFLNTL